ncbi:hypothetical protein [Terribacillus sp. JSM ZJ617]|uniref:hypothetical protein n=1 Tax=Terribacillus sp. JSM ZJ617 TaxID=3342119 RepID=UPI0035A8DDA9
MDALCEIYGKKPTDPGSDADQGVIGKLVVVKNNSDGWLWTYNSANWNDKAIKVKTGEAFTITKELTVSGSKMYQIKSGLLYYCFH